MTTLETTIARPDGNAVTAKEMMNALVYLGPGNKVWGRAPKPHIQEPTDAVVRITTSTICGTDLHILKGDVPTVEEGRILGHEGVGIVEETGNAVSNFSRGDKVLISCITSCSRCGPCRRGMYSHCEKGGWILGHRIDGTQADYVRIPFADTSLHLLGPEANEDAAVLLSDIFPTAYECGVLNGQVKPGDSVAIVGAGPIGLAALVLAQLYSPTELILIDVDRNRLETALQLGATMTIYSADGRAAEKVLAYTAGAGVDVVIEAVGTPDTFELCQAIVAAGGRLANVGVHGCSAKLHLDRLWAQNITITTRLVDTVTTPLLLKLLKKGKLEPQKFVTHHFRLAATLEAYDTFSNAAHWGALKVILRASNV